MSQTKATLKRFSNGASVKLPNRRITVSQNDAGAFFIQFRHADNVEDPNKPACEHICIKGKVHQTTVKLSVEAMESIVIAFQEYTNQRMFNQLHSENRIKYVVKSFHADNTFEGYLSAYSPTSESRQFSENDGMAIRFDTIQECIYYDGQQWEDSRGGKGYYSVDAVVIPKK